MHGEDTFREMTAQPEAWEGVIAAVDAMRGPLDDELVRADGILLTGCGSALNIAHAGARVLQRYTGLPARVVPAADLFQFPEANFPRGEQPLTIAISRSGETTETVFARRAAAARGCRTLALTCENNTMSREADLALVLDSCRERSICTTQSVSGMVLALQLLAAGGDPAFATELRQLPAAGRRIMDRAVQAGRALGADPRIRKHAFLGSGPLYGIARECQLKVKEMTLLPADAYPVMEYRHGPKSNVDEAMLVTLLCSDSGHNWELECATELLACGGQLLAIADAPSGPEGAITFPLESGLSEYARAVLCLPVVQAMAITQALGLGMDPDAPRHLSYWVATKAGGATAP